MFTKTQFNQYKMKKENTILLLLAAYGIWWWYSKNKSAALPVSSQPVLVNTETGDIVTNVAPATPFTSLDGSIADVNKVVSQPAAINVQWAMSGTKRFGKVPNTI